MSEAATMPRTEWLPHGNQRTTHTRLLHVEPLANPTVVFLFARLHGSRRENDGHDPEHGRRGANLARQLQSERALEIEPEQLDILVKA